MAAEKWFSEDGRPELKLIREALKYE